MTVGYPLPIFNKHKRKLKIRPYNRLKKELLEKLVLQEKFKLDINL